MEIPKTIAEYLPSQASTTTTKKKQKDLHHLNPLISKDEVVDVWIDGKHRRFSYEGLLYFWKQAFGGALVSVSPGFTIDERNRALLNQIFLWMCPEFGESSFDSRKGLLFWGGLGTGKTTLLKGIQRFLGYRNKGIYSCNNKDIGIVIKSAAEISLQYASEGMKSLERWTDREKAVHLAIDEIGREEISSHFGTPCNTIQTILQLRYEQRHEILTLGTTNIDMMTDEFSNRYGSYIFDRVKEMFNVIRVGGESRRK